jgi:hypothetical protein
MVLAAGGFLLVWCDNDENDGPLHTNFKLSGSGEEIGLFGRLAAGNDVIDSHVFGVQATDTSMGRSPDGGAGWQYFSPPTPGASNQMSDSCCTGIRGNTNNDPLEVIDISDLVYLVDYMFTSGPAPACPEESNLDASCCNEGSEESLADIDISDLVYLVDYMFTEGPPPPLCP